MEINSLKSLDDFQKYIDENNIKSRKEFRKNYKTLYKKYLNCRKTWVSKKDIVFKETFSNIKFSNLNTVEDFQKYIDENGIKSKKEFRKLGSLSDRFFRKIPKEDRNKLIFKETDHYLFGNEFSTVEDFQKFVDENNIKKPIEFKKKYPKIYDRFCRIIPKEQKKKLRYENRLNSYSEIITINDLQNFIIINEVNSRKELHKRFPGLYIKFQKDLDSVNFTNNSISIGVEFLKRLFRENNIKFITEKTYPDLKNILPLRYDFYLPEYNILIEHHGEGHFGKGRYYTSTLIENDKLKYNYAINNNIPILYFTIYKRDYFNNGYFTEVLTDPQIFIQQIKEIGLTNRSNIDN